MPSYRHHDFGNLYIRFEVKFPKPQFNSLDAIQQLHHILPPAETRSLPPSDAMMEDYELVDVTADQRARSQAAGAMDEEDDDVPAGAERVQCASQ